MQTIKASMDELEALRTAELQQAGNFLQQKQQHLQRERKRLAAKYGEQYPDVQQIDARLRFEDERTKTVHDEAERSTVKTEPFSITSWRVNGMVLDKTGKGLQGVTVFLANESQQPVEGAPHACSDEKGFYAITLDKAIIERLKGKPLFLAAVLKDQQKPFFTTEALQATVGIIEYRDILLAEKECDAPPSSPDTKPKSPDTKPNLK